MDIVNAVRQCIMVVGPLALKKSVLNEDLQVVMVFRMLDS
jgi:hypothetical protein